MIHHYPKLKVAAAHVAPVFLDTERTVDKACSLIAEAAQAGARLIVFPEAFVPAFPIWTAIAAPILTHELFKSLASCAIEITGPEIARLKDSARRNEICVSIGFNEGTKASVGCIWNSNVLIGEDGSLLNHHRKLVPTYYEKLVWSSGDGAGLRVVETSIGRIGMLICGENTNPLARYSLMAQGEQIHISTYPPIWPTRPSREAGGYDIEQAIRIRAGAHSFEAKVFNIVASAAADDTMRAKLEAVLGASALELIDNTPQAISVVIGPSGLPVSPVVSGEETLLYCDIDLADCVEPKQFHDVVGYYNRFDIFKLEVNREANRPIVFRDDIRGEPRDPYADVRQAGVAGPSAPSDPKVHLLDA
jgi:aliphatic nitrilase